VAGLLGGAAVLGVLVGLTASYLRVPEPGTELDVAAEAAERAVPSGAATESSDNMAADPDLLANIPSYPRRVTEPRRIATNGQMLGAPYSLAWFHTDDSIDEVMQHYQAEIGKTGVLMTSHVYSPTLAYVGWMPKFSQRLEDGGRVAAPMYLVGLTKQVGKTLVMMSKTFPEAMAAGASSLPDGVVLPPAAKDPSVIDVSGEVGGGARKAIYAQVTDATVADVEAFYRKHMAATGWKVDEHDSALGLVGERGRWRWSVVVKQQGPDAQVLMTHERR
jgi:hypothetical protein